MTPSDPPASPATGRGFAPAAAVLAAALATRVGWALAVEVRPEADCVVYDLLARNIAAGLGYAWKAGEPTAYWPVGPSALFGACYRLFGSGYLAPTVVLTLAGVGIVALGMAVARRYFGDRVAARAGWILALWPLLIEFTTVLGSEVPFLFLMLAAWLLFPEGPALGLGRSALSGVATAAMSFMRPTGLLMPLVFAAAGAARGDGVRRSLARAAVATAALAVCVSPWTYRNYRVFGELVVISTNGGPNTWMGNHPGTNGGYVPLPDRVADLPEVERDRVLSREARDYIKADPLAFALRSVWKALRLHERESIGVAWNGEALGRVLPPPGVLALKLASNVYWWVALALGLAGVRRLLRTSGLAAAVHPMVLVWGYFTAVHAVTVIQDRYHMPVIPCVAALGAFALEPRAARRGVNPARHDADETPPSEPAVAHCADEAR